MFLLLALFWASGVMCYCCLHCLLPAGVTVLALLRQYLACRSDAFLLPVLLCSPAGVTPSARPVASAAWPRPCRLTWKPLLPSQAYWNDMFLLNALLCYCRSDAFSFASRFGSLAEAMQADAAGGMQE